jgi:hypothetical protein
MSLGTGRPIILRDENCVRFGRVLLNHHMASPTDVRLISLVDLVAQKSKATFPLLIADPQRFFNPLQLKSMRLWRLSMGLSTTVLSR